MSMLHRFQSMERQPERWAFVPRQRRRLAALRFDAALREVFARVVLRLLAVVRALFAAAFLFPALRGGLARFFVALRVGAGVLAFLRFRLAGTTTGGIDGSVDGMISLSPASIGFGVMFADTTL